MEHSLAVLDEWVLVRDTWIKNYSNGARATINPWRKEGNCGEYSVIDGWMARAFSPTGVTLEHFFVSREEWPFWGWNSRNTARQANQDKQFWAAQIWCDECSQPQKPNLPSLDGPSETNPECTHLGPGLDLYLWWEGDCVGGKLVVEGVTLLTKEAKPRCEDYFCDCVANHPESAWDEVEKQLRKAAKIVEMYCNIHGDCG